jgi:peptidoglycan/xylan/chitin deacetylase (PgdA/CDA1 family)
MQCLSTAFFFIHCMGFYWVKTNRVIKRVFKNFVWHLPNKEKKVYLTFDDGPTPEVTEWVLSILSAHRIKATFFCIGNNIEKHPEIFSKVVAGGHAIGNHTYNHLNGWNTDNQTYFENIAAAEKSIAGRLPTLMQNKLFRPPYGKMKASQSAQIRKQGYKIIMWDVLSADFDQAISPEKCLRNVTNNTCEGSIIIFHDSVKAYKNLSYALPKAIEYLKRKNYYFDKID